MENIKTSYIMSKNEILFLANSVSQKDLKKQAKYFFKTYFFDIELNNNVQEGLIEKNLAKEVVGTLVIEPVINLIIKTLIEPISLQTTHSIDNNRNVIIMESNEMLLLLIDYGLIPNTWKITPYKNRAALISNLPECIDVLDIMTVEDNGQLL